MINFQTLPFFSPSLASHLAEENTTHALSLIIEKLIENSGKFNLTSIRDPDEIVRKHIVDSLIPLAALEKLTIISTAGEDKNLLDVGCGAGFPSLPIAAASRNYFPLHVTALDSTAKKIAHVRESAACASLDNLTAVVGRAEELAHTEYRAHFELTIARAVASLPVLLELCTPFLTKGGFFCAMKSHAEDELALSHAAAEKLGVTLRHNIAYEIPGGDTRALLIYEKTADTPRKYPRRYAEISKQPIR